MNSFGLTPAQEKLLFSLLKKHLGDTQTCTAWIFGSRATGHQRPYSDIDLLVESVPTLEGERLERLSEDFEESELPFKVDLVPAQNLLDAYRDSVMRDRQVFWRK